MTRLVGDLFDLDCGTQWPAVAELLQRLLLRACMAGELPECKVQELRYRLSTADAGDSVYSHDLDKHDCRCLANCLAAWLERNTAGFESEGIVASDELLSAAAGFFAENHAAEFTKAA